MSDKELPRHRQHLDHAKGEPCVICDATKVGREAEGDAGRVENTPKPRSASSFSSDQQSDAGNQ
jgi:hypothetical protein